MRLAVVVVDVRSAQNVGSIFRSADAFGVEKVVLAGISPYPEIANDSRLPHVRAQATKMIAKSALGAEQTVKFEYVSTALAAVESLKKQGYKLVALEQHPGSITLDKLQKSNPLAIIVGNELTGLTGDVLNNCYVVAEIPMHGNKESLNVAVAAGIAMYCLSS